MESDPLKQLWRQEASNHDRAGTWSREELVSMVQERAAEVRTSLRRRLKREIGYYAIILAILLPSIVYPSRSATLVAAGAIALLLLGVIATLRWGARRLTEPDLDGPAGETVRRTLRVVQTTLRSYLIAYMLCVGVGAAIAIVLVVAQHPGDPRWIIPVSVGGALAVWWSHHSGRAYLDRHFGR